MPDILARRPGGFWNAGEVGREAFVRRFTFLYVFVCLVLELAARLPLGGEYLGVLVGILFAYLVLSLVWILLAERADQRAADKQKERV